MRRHNVAELFVLSRQITLITADSLYRKIGFLAYSIEMAQIKKRNSGHLSIVTACISTTMVLTLVGTVVFFVAMANNLSRSLRENFTVQVMLNDSITHNEAYRLQTLLKQQPYTKQVVYISKEKATLQQAEVLDVDPKDFLGYSPFPASFELHLKAEYADTDSLSKYMPMLRRDARISDVAYPEDLMKTVNQNIRQVSLVLLIVAALLTFISISLINNTLRMSVAKRRHAIQTMKLVGAKWGFIRRPFLIQAFFIGLFASIAADLVLAGGMVALNRWDEGISLLTTLPVQAVTLIAVPLIGITLTVICAFFSVNKHLGMSRNEAYLY